MCIRDRVILWMATRKTDLTALVGGGKVSAAGWQTLATYGIFLAAMFVLVASIGRRAPPPVQVQTCLLYTSRCV